jgi:hypothetical protein
MLKKFVPQENVGLEKNIKMGKMNFHIDLFRVGDNLIDFHGQGEFSIKYDEVVIDPSFLFYLCSHKIMESEVTYYIPDNLLRLIERSKENSEYRQFLKSFLSFFRYGFSRNLSEEDWYLFFDNIQRMNIKPITQEMLKPEENNDYYYDYLKFFQNHVFYLSMSPRINFLGDCIAKIMEYSRQSGILIISKSRKLANLLREKIVSLELPQSLAELPNDLDAFFRHKSDLLNKIFDFPGGRPTKFFIGVCLGIGGFIHPAIGGLGVAFVFMDP